MKNVLIDIDTVQRRCLGIVKHVNPAILNYLIVGTRKENEKVY